MAVGFALDPIHRYCMREKLPPLSILVVNKTGLAREGVYGLGMGATSMKGCELVFNYPWASRSNPFLYAATGARIEGLATELLSAADPGEIYTRVKDRGAAQELFREVMLRTYRSRCAVCAFPIVDALDAAHHEALVCLQPTGSGSSRQTVSCFVGIITHCSTRAFLRSSRRWSGSRKRG